MKSAIRVILWIAGLFLFTNHIAYAQNWTLPTPSQEACHPAIIPQPKFIASTRKTIDFTELSILFSGSVDCSTQQKVKREVIDISNSLKFKSVRKKTCEIRFTTPSRELKTDEAYTLQVNKQGIIIEANAFGGYFNALQTLRQMITESPHGMLRLHYCNVDDLPEFSVRSVMIDVGRNFLEISFLREVIRKLSMYKINMLHLHLTDNPGWRIEVKSHPELTSYNSYWKTRQPGKFYTQKEIKEFVAYCDSLNVRVLPEVDMPGHSAYFKKATGYDMQTSKGIAILKEALDEVIPLFKDSLFHIGSDEVRFAMPEFMPEMIKYIRDKGKRIVIWSPGYQQDNDCIRMFWGKCESGHQIKTDIPYIDGNGFYMDYMDSQSGVQQVFFQQPCEVASENTNALGGVMCVWTDGGLGEYPEKQILTQYPFYPTLLTYAERIWRGAKESANQFVANMPKKGSSAWIAFDEFENRLVAHRDKYFQGIPFAYVKQSELKWRIIGPFDHKGINDTSFEPERIIKSEYIDNNKILKWKDEAAYGGVVQIRSLYAMFNMHNNRYQPNLWPTLMSDDVGIGNGTCYALTYIKSLREQDVFLMCGFNGMWGHSGGYRSERAPQQGSWDWSGGDIWLNENRIEPPVWDFESLPWSGWGQGRIEIPLTGQGYFYRAPIKISLKKGLNKVLVRVPFGHWNGDEGQRRWQFCFMPVKWDGIHYSEVEGLEYETDIK